MYRNLIALSMLLSLNLSFGATVKNFLIDLYSNSTRQQIITSYIYDNQTLIKMQHQVELLSHANENLRIRLETINDRLDHQSEILEEIKENLFGSQRTSVTSNSFDTEINKPGLRTETNEERLGEITRVLNELKKSLSTKDGRETTTSCLDLSGGVQLIQIDGFSPRPFNVLCDNATHGGGWTVIQKRFDGSVDFNRNWTEYKCGFGDLEGEFFIGLHKLHALTNEYVNELLIIMRDKENVERFAKYNAFAIGDESEHYALNILGNYSGDAGDSLGRNRLQRFYTKDDDNSYNCAGKYSGGWWFANCGFSLLNGKYGDSTFAKGINWGGFHDFEYSLPYVKMLIRPKSPCS